MKIRFLGTGGVLGAPVWNCNCKTCTSDNSKNTRFRSALFVTIGSIDILIDFGQDIAQQLRINKIKKLDYAFLTHPHQDHVFGAEQLSVAENIKLMAAPDVMMNVNANILKWLKDKNPSLTTSTEWPINIGGVEIDTVKLVHQKSYTPEYQPCVGFLFRSPDFSFAYLSDYNDILEKHKLGDLDLIISDGNQWKDVGRGHIGVEGAINIFNELKPKKMLLTHLSHKTEHSDIEEYLKNDKDIAPAYDGLEVQSDFIKNWDHYKGQ